MTSLKSLVILLFALMVFSSTNTFEKLTKIQNHVSIKNLSPNSKINFDENWLFSQSIDSIIVFQKSVGNCWRKLNLPHDWAIEDSVSFKNKSGIDGGFFVAGKAWYRKDFDAFPEWKDKKTTVCFDGVFMNSDVWINGRYIGHNTNGYSGFRIDITPYLKFNEQNSIVVRVDNNTPPANRWYTGSGIYRHTWIETTGKVYIPFGGTYLTTKTTVDRMSLVNLQTTIQNETGVKQNLTVVYEVKDRSKRTVANLIIKNEIDKNAVIPTQLTIKNANLWSDEFPYLYTLEITIKSDVKTLFHSSQPFGIRNIAFDKDSGFVLNGKKVILKGVCIHHDAGSLGAAVPDAVYYRQLKLLKELGCNAIRMSHNPQSPVLLDLCDSLGFLVIDEMFDKWSGRLTGYNSTEIFEKERESDLTNFILRDRNRPSVILWTVGNETDEQLNNPLKGVSILQKLKSIVESVDKSRHVSCAMHPGIMGVGPYSEMIKSTDIICYNYRTHDFPEWRKSFPNSVFIASETKAYLENAVKHSKEIDYTENTWFQIIKNPFIAGQFIWAGIDYLGESMAWPRKGLTNGLLLTNGFFKPYAYFTQSVYSKKPMVHIAVVDDSLAYITDTTKHWQKSWFGPAVASHWNLYKNKNDSVTVLTYSNCSEVELFLNNKSLGIKQLRDFPDKVIKWRVAYEKGKMQAIGKKSGKSVSHKLETAGKATQLEISTEDPNLSMPQSNVMALIVSVVDQKQRLCPQNKNKISLAIEGGAKIIGVDNGDLSYHGSFKSNDVEARNGKALVWIQIIDKTRKVLISAKSIGLKSSTFEFVKNN